MTAERVMIIPAGNNLFVEYTRGRGAGTVWVVRVYRKSLFFRKTIASDWFLDEDQARRFAEKTAEQLKLDGSADLIRKRRPGWIMPGGKAL